jgi:threonine synthase
MRYVSTRGAAPVLDFEGAMLAGLARDGGLYVPESWPTLSRDTIAGFAGAPYEDVAAAVMAPFVGDAFGASEFGQMIERAYAGFGHPARAPLAQLGPNDWLLELFHGPTLAFKDFAMQLIGVLFDAALTRRGERITIVCATSGDTGAAAVEAFRGRDAVDLIVLFPEGRISEVQRRQMTTPEGANVHALAVQGDFDACQALVKAMFNDFPFRDAVGLAAVNSINWARVLAQAVYYFSSATALGAPGRAIAYAVPTGNFGDIYAGDVARRMGLPVSNLIIATNSNDILHRTLEAGDHRKAAVSPTISPSMDIQVSSNFERLLHELYDRDAGAVAQQMAALKDEGGFTLSQGVLGRLREGFGSGRASEAETMAEIGRTFRAAGYVLDPHTAVGVCAAAANRGDPRTPMVTLSTAHPAKFPDAVEEACGVRPALPSRMADLYEREERVTVVPDDLGAVEALIRERIRR